MSLHEALEFGDLIGLINDDADAPEDAEHAPERSLAEWERRRCRHLAPGKLGLRRPARGRLLKVMRGKRILWSRKGQYADRLTETTVKTAMLAAATMVARGEAERGTFKAVLSAEDDILDLSSHEFKA